MWVVIRGNLEKKKETLWQIKCYRSLEREKTNKILQRTVKIKNLGSYRKLSLKSAGKATRQNKAILIPKVPGTDEEKPLQNVILNMRP